MFERNNTHADSAASSAHINIQNHERLKIYLRETTNARTVETNRWQHVQLGSQIGFVGMSEERYPAIIILGNGHQIAPRVKKWTQVQLGGSRIAFVACAEGGFGAITMMKNGYQIELHGDELVVFNMAEGRQNVTNLTSKNQIIAQVAAHLAMPAAMTQRP